MARAKAPPEHLFVETDGQVYLVKERGRWRFPRASESLPFPATRGHAMDFGTEVVRRIKPKLAYHPEEWFQRDELFSRRDVDGLVKKAVYMTMGRMVAEVVVVRDGKVLMEKASRGFSKGHWNLPGGFLDFGEAPEEAARRETEEELGVRVRIDGPVDTYLSGFPGKPTFTYGFVYRASLLSEKFRLKADEVEAVAWWPAWRAVELTRNPFAKWAIADVYRGGFLPELKVDRHRPPPKAAKADGPVVFLDRDDTINRGREGYVQAPAHLEFLPGALAAMRTLNGLGYRLAVVTNQDVMGWGVISNRELRTVHDAMFRAFRAAKVRVENVYYCRHHLFEDCPCRKPRAGLLLAACKDLGACPRDAWMVGDKVGDVLAGKAIGARTVFVGDAVRRRKFAEELAAGKPDVSVPSLAAFARALQRGTVPTSSRPALT